MKVIDNFYYREYFKVGKPNPEIFRLIAEEQKVKLHEIVYLGDSIPDAECAIGAGIDFVASLESKLRLRSEFEIHNVNHFISKFSELPSVLLEIEKNTD